MLGESLELHPITVLLSLIFWGILWGISGMLLAAPITAVLKILLDNLDLTKPLARLLEGDFQTNELIHAPKPREEYSPTSSPPETIRSSTPRPPDETKSQPPFEESMLPHTEQNESSPPSTQNVAPPQEDIKPSTE